MIVVEETGTPLDTAEGECVRHAAPPGVRSLASCTLYAAFLYNNALPPGENGFILLAPGRYHLEAPLPPIEHGLSLRGAEGHFGSGAPLVVDADIEGGRAEARVAPARVPAELPVLDCMHEHRGLEVAPDVHVSIQHVGIVNGYGDRGGGILQARSGSGQLRLVDVHIASCTAVYGGALYAESRVDIRSSTMNANEATKCGGAIYVLGKVLSADKSTFNNNKDECTRRDERVDIEEAVQAKGSTVNVIVVGSSVELTKGEWAEEDRRIRAEREESALRHAGWLKTGRPRRPRQGLGL